jgi:hypothetical protein
MAVTPWSLGTPDGRLDDDAACAAWRDHGTTPLCGPVPAVSPVTTLAFIAQATAPAEAGTTESPAAAALAPTPEPAARAHRGSARGCGPGRAGRCLAAPQRPPLPPTRRRPGPHWSAATPRCRFPDAQGHRSQDDAGQADRPPRLHGRGGRHAQRGALARGKPGDLQGPRGDRHQLRGGRRKAHRTSASTDPEQPVRQTG